MIELPFKISNRKICLNSPIVASLEFGHPSDYSRVAVAMSRLPDSSLLAMPAMIPVLFPEREGSQVPASSSHLPRQCLPNTVQSLLWAPVLRQGHRGLNAGRFAAAARGVHIDPAGTFYSDIWF